MPDIRQDISLSIDYKERILSTRIVSDRLSEGRLESLKELLPIAEELLKIADDAFRLYTTHDIGHACRVLENVERILCSTALADGTSLYDALDDYAIAIVIFASLLHDIGMGPKNEAERGLFDRQELTDVILDEWREKHHTRTHEMIVGFFDSSFRLIEDIIEPVAEVAQAHRDIPILVHPYFQPNEDANEEEKRLKMGLRILSAILRLADQMDLSKERVTERLRYKPLHRLSHLLQTEETDRQQRQVTAFLQNFVSKEWELIQQDSNQRTLTLTSKMVFDDLTLRTLASLDELVGDIERTIEETKNVSFCGEEILPKILSVDFSVKGEKSHQHGLTADFKNVWQYLSKDLYNERIRPYIPLREAVTNAVDACRHLSPSENPNIAIYDKKDKIVIEDTGIGLSLDVIENHLKVLGSSYYSSKRYEGWLNAQGLDKVSTIGRFGIGTFSFLLLSDGYEIETLRLGYEPYHVHFSKLFGVTTEGSRSSQGTSVYLPCPGTKRPTEWEDSSKLRTLLESIFPRHAVPITFFNSMGDEKKLRTIDQRNHNRLPDMHPKFTLGGTRIAKEFDVGFKVHGEYDFPWNLTATLFTEIPIYFRNLRRRWNILQPLIMLMGMRLQTLDLMLPIPSALAMSAYGKELIERRSFRVMRNDPKRSPIWIDIKDTTDRLALSKDKFEEFYPISVIAALKELQELCLEPFLSLLEAPKLPRLIKDCMRFMIPYAYSYIRKSRLYFLRRTAPKIQKGQYERIRDLAKQTEILLKSNDRFLRAGIDDYPCLSLTTGRVVRLKSAYDDSNTIVAMHRHRESRILNRRVLVPLGELDELDFVMDYIERKTAVF